MEFSWLPLLFEPRWVMARRIGTVVAYSKWGTSGGELFLAAIPRERLNLS